ncbi:SIS domain-containing protein [Patescibacteria group bacterium]
MDKLDSLGIGKALELFPEQIKRTFKQALLEINVIKLAFNSVIVCGMGGSSNAGKILQSLVETDNSIPMHVYNDYDLPSWVNKNTLVVLNSYSGNTEETLSAYPVALKNNCQIVGITTGGKVAELIKEEKIKGAIISAGDTNPSGYPKSGLGLSLGALMGVLVKVGFINFSESDIDDALNELKKIRSEWNVEEIAQKLKGKTPIYFSGRSLVGALNAARNATCEIGRVFTQFYDFPEVNHVLIEALSLPKEVKNNRYLFFESKFDNERIKLRYKITKELLKKQELKYLTYSLKGSTKFVQCLELAHFGAWIGYYLSILRKDDPGPEPWIIELKNRLSQPTH